MCTRNKVAGILFACLSVCVLLLPIQHVVLIFLPPNLQLSIQIFTLLNWSSTLEKDYFIHN